MKVLKFGSASIATAGQLQSVADIVSKSKGNIIVLSSMKGTSEALAEIAEYFYKKNSEGACEIVTKLEIDHLALVSNLFDSDKYKKEAVEVVRATFDYIRSFSADLFSLFEERIVLAQGELLSSKLFYFLLKERNVNVALIPALDYIRTDRNSVPDASFIKENLTALLEKEKQADLFITQGYICRNSYGEIDDLRRGGSDLTASLVGVALSVEEIQIWADVDMMLNNDSRYVERTSVVDQLSFDEAAELAYFGEKILHPTSISPAKSANIPVRLVNTEFPDAEGTLISNITETQKIKAVAAKENITAIKIKSGKMLLAHGFLRRVFEVFEQYQTPIDMLTTSEVGISVTIDNVHNLPKIVEDLKKYGTVSVDENMVIIAIIGDLDWEKTRLDFKIFEAMKDIPVRMISYGGSNNNISFLVKREDKEKTLRLLNDKLF